MRILWRIVIFVAVVILAALAIAIGAAALAIFIVLVVICCPCIFAYQVRGMAYPRVAHVDYLPPRSFLCCRFAGSIIIVSALAAVFCERLLCTNDVGDVPSFVSTQNQHPESKLNAGSTFEQQTQFRTSPVCFHLPARQVAFWCFELSSSSFLVF